jgi:Calcineurin-like phosphoesterase
MRRSRNWNALIVISAFAFGACIFINKANAANTIAQQGFTVVVLPDTQGYTVAFPGIFDAQTEWIVKNKTNLNIAFVIHTGDLIEHVGNATEWRHASHSMAKLDGVVPYGISPANHDLDDGTHTGATGAGSIFRRYFPISRFSRYPWWGGYYDVNKIDRNSSYQLFSIGSMEFIVMCLEWEAPDDVLAWARGVLKTYPNYRAIVATHHYLNPSPPARDTSWPFPRSGGNLGEDIWQKFVRSQPNIFMVHSGHIFGQGMQTSTNDFGKRVYEIVANYHPALPNGGNGWLRYYTFKPSLNQIHAFTYSPTLSRFAKDANSQFVLTYNMTTAFKSNASQ